MTQEGASFSKLGYRVLPSTGVGTPAGRQPGPRAADYKVRTPGPPSRIPGSTQTKAATKPLDKNMAAHSECGQPGDQHLIILPSLGPHETKGLAKGAVTPSLPCPHGHTHSPFLNTSRRAGRCRPRNTTMPAADDPQSTKQHFQYSPAPRGLGRCRDAKQAPCQPAAQHSSSRRGRGCSRFSSHLCDTSRPSTNPTPMPPNTGGRETEAQRLGALLLGMTGGSREKAHNASCGSLTLLSSSCQNIWVPELREGSQLPDGRWKSHQTRLGMAPMKTQSSWLIR